MPASFSARLPPTCMAAYPSSDKLSRSCNTCSHVCLLQVTCSSTALLLAACATQSTCTATKRCSRWAGQPLCPSVQARKHWLACGSRDVGEHACPLLDLPLVFQGWVLNAVWQDEGRWHFPPSFRCRCPCMSALPHPTPPCLAPRWRWSRA